jgi:hypothetical protein
MAAHRTAKSSYGSIVLEAMGYSKICKEPIGEQFGSEPTKGVVARMCKGDRG